MHEQRLEDAAHLKRALGLGDRAELVQSAEHQKQSDHELQNK